MVLAARTSPAAAAGCAARYLLGAVPRFLDTEDVQPQPQPQSAAPPASPRRFDTDDPRVIHFDDDAYRDLQQLQSQLRNADDIEGVVYTALELLGLALSYDLQVDSKLRRGQKRVYNLWR